MFKRIRIVFLLYVLVAVALGQFLSSRRSTDWDASLWVDVYLIDAAAGGDSAVFLDSLDRDAYADVERFFLEQSRPYGIMLDQPFRIRVAGRLDEPLPAIAPGGGVLSTIVWSLRMRWFVTRLHWSSDAPTPDVTLFAIYHDIDSERALDRSTALRKGMIAIANLFASPLARGSNQMIVAHELLHTLGATDKYDPATGLPRFPDGFADPGQTPLYPQTRAELMAGRILLDEDQAEIPGSLDKLVIGPATAAEIGWSERR